MQGANRREFGGLLIVGFAGRTVVECGVGAGGALSHPREVSWLYG